MRTLLLSQDTGHVPSGSGASSRGHTTLIISSVTTGDRYVREEQTHLLWINICKNKTMF